MTKYIPVTVAQVEGLRKVANDKKVGLALFQKALDNGSFARYLDSLKADEQMEYTPLSDKRIAELTKMATSVGARICVLRRVRVQQDRDWQDSINLVGPSTPMNYNVRKPEVSAQYQSVSKKTVEKDIVLLNYLKGGDWNKATMWGQSTFLKAANPREVFAVGEQYPTLNKTLGQDLMCLVAPIECTFFGNRRACFVWWLDSDRKADLSHVNSFYDTYAWFAFSE